MNLWRSAAGELEGTLISADPFAALESVRMAGISLRNVRQEKPLELTFRVDRREWKILSQLCSRKGYDLFQRKNSGIYWKLKALVKRPVLLMTVGMLLLLGLWLPTRVLFFRVVGNDSIPDKQILEAGEVCGIHFGASRRQVRSEKMKNALLDNLPQLQWAGINTSGCTAVISVRQRQENVELKEQGIGTIVASRDGYVTECTVSAGNPLCSPGQTVKAGEILISPYTDCGIAIRVENADGEVYAQTRHQIRAAAISKGYLREVVLDAEHRYGLILGKKRINLWKDSGIFHSTCGRMYEEYYITLPGGFKLPVAVAVETVTHWNIQETVQDSSVIEASMVSFARDSVTARMISGKILEENFLLTQEENVCLLEADFVCNEMIGREIRGKIGELHEQNS